MQDIPKIKDYLSLGNVFMVYYISKLTEKNAYVNKCPSQKADIPVEKTKQNRNRDNLNISVYIQNQACLNKLWFSVQWTTVEPLKRMR